MNINNNIKTIDIQDITERGGGKRKSYNHQKIERERKENYPERP